MTCTDTSEAGLERTIVRSLMDVLLKGVKHRSYAMTLFYGSLTARNEKAKGASTKHIFSFTRRLY